MSREKSLPGRLNENAIARVLVRALADALVRVIVRVCERLHVPTFPRARV